MTRQDLEKIYEYEPITGKLTRKTYCGRGYAGQIIKSTILSINYRRVNRARVIWCLYYGEWPPDDKVVDHKDRNHDNDAIDNLRLADKTENSHNINYRPYQGTYFVAPNSWAAKIHVDGEQVHLGCYRTREEAAAAYLKKAKETRGEFACHL